MQFVLITVFVCRMPSWTPKTQPNGGSLSYSVADWVRFLVFNYIYEKKSTVRTGLCRSVLYNESCVEYQKLNLV